jgi:MFS family permease
MSARLVAARRSGSWGTVLAVAGLMLALFLVALDQTVVGTALPKVIAELNGFERYAWVTTAYLLASTSMIPIIGKLGTSTAASGSSYLGSSCSS